MLHMKHSMNTCAANQIAFASQMKSMICFEAFLFKSRIIQEKHPQYFERVKKHRAKILALHDSCLDDENRLCRKRMPPLIVRDWQLYTAIINLHCQIPHGGQGKTFIRLSEQDYGIIRPEVR